MVDRGSWIVDASFTEIGVGVGGSVSSSDPLIEITGHAFGEKEIRAASAALSSASISTGPRAARFEAELASFFGAAEVLAVNSCTAAMHLALCCLGVGPGDEVITSTVTFPATINAIIATGALPVLADVDPVSLNLSPDGVRAAIGSRTRAILPVHVGGAACDMASLRRVADEFSLPLVADCAHAVDTWVGAAHVAGLADISCFSFYATKNLTTVEGGALVAAAETVRRARLLARHGLDFSWSGTNTGTAEGYEPVAAGFKYNLSDVNAAIGLVQLARLPELQARRRANAAVYDAAFADNSHITLPFRTSLGEHSWYLYQVQVELGLETNTSAALKPYLRQAGISTGAYYRPLHTYDLYARLCRTPEPPVRSESAYRRLLALPVHPGVSPTDAERIADRLLAAVDAFRSAVPVAAAHTA